MFLDIDTAALLSKGIILAGLATCGGTPRNIDVDVIFEHIEAPYVTNMSSTELETIFTPDPDSTMATEAGLWKLGGMNKSTFGGSYNVSYQSYLDKKANAYCYAPEKVTYKLTYTNTIYIASDALLKGCRFSVTKAHEKRHVNTDIRVSRDYVLDIKKALEAGVKDIKYIPHEAGREQEVLGVFLAPLKAKVDPVLEKMKTERRKKQAEIDTRDNYLRDSALCPHQ